jgi:hypothetical protein
MKEPEKWNNDNISTVHVPCGSSDMAVGTKIEVVSMKEPEEKICQQCLNPYQKGIHKCKNKDTIQIDRNVASDLYEYLLRYTKLDRADNAMSVLRKALGR